jgi:hypothetical protein
LQLHLSRVGALCTLVYLIGADVADHGLQAEIENYLSILNRICDKKMYALVE